jgi:hypothetical protein
MPLALLKRIFAVMSHCIHYMTLLRKPFRWEILPYLSFVSHFNFNFYRMYGREACVLSINFRDYVLNTNLCVLRDGAATSKITGADSKEDTV